MIPGAMNDVDPWTHAKIAEAPKGKPWENKFDGCSDCGGNPGGIELCAASGEVYIASSFRKVQGVKSAARCYHFGS